MDGLSNDVKVSVSKPNTGESSGTLYLKTMSAFRGLEITQHALGVGGYVACLIWRAVLARLTLPSPLGPSLKDSGC